MRKWRPQECLFCKSESGCRFGEKCSFAHRQADEQPTKRSQKNDDKSAVALLKKGNWQERELVTDGCHDRPVKPGKRGDKKLGQNSFTRGISMPNFEVFDVRIASALNKIIHNSHFKRRIRLKEQKPRSKTVSFAAVAADRLFI